ncbi:MAG: hypothetical protein E6Q97_14200 [Desulfurellales bacterium]|nr:MAG: hypothetical protein E6Q97_14200 [Desulfurellales bacterium]
MKRLLFFLTYLHRLDELERRVAHLEALTQAQIEYSDRAHRVLTSHRDAGTCYVGDALHTFLSWWPLEQTAPAVIIGDWLITAGAGRRKS